MALLESGEMYLETILILSGSIERVRSIDVGEYMGFSKPSVSRAMNNLRKDEYIETDDDGYIVLTKKGRSIAEKIYERHVVLTEFLKKLGISDTTAVNDACKIEHDISDETFNAIKDYLIKD